VTRITRITRINADERGFKVSRLYPRNSLFIRVDPRSRLFFSSTFQALSFFRVTAVPSLVSFFP
jgi:hypothetical protein